ncbi:MAG: phospholipid carrier-dependent glycosyltransferase [Kiritimatiellales bacterium]|nr:phospholipid carrier-dependent glycosyltransferase [Kiritimatiellales bacterium]
MQKTTIGLLLLFAGIYLFPLNPRPLFTPDEMRYGEIAREMLASGDFVVPRLNGVRYFEKPALGHVLNAGALAVFGESNFAVRFMSALSVGITALALFLLMKRERGDRAAALSAFIYLSSSMVIALGTFSVLDNMLTCFITLALCCFYVASATQNGTRKRFLALAGLGLFAGCAFLVKGFIALAVPLIVVVPYLLLQRRWKELFIMPWIPLLAALAVALPWSIAIALREPDFWRYFFWEEHVRRFFAGEHAQHAQPFLYFVPVFIGGLCPWSLIAPVPLVAVVKKRWKEPFVQFCLLWLVLPFLFFSASSGKLGTYILPCFPPVAMLLGIGILDFHDQGKDKFFRIGAWIMFGIFAVALMGVILAGVLPIAAVKPYGDGELHKYFIAFFSIAGAALVGWLALHRKGMNKFILFGLTTAALGLGAPFCIPEQQSIATALDGFCSRQMRHLPARAIIVSDKRTFHGVCFRFKRDDVYIKDSMGELDYGLGYPEAAYRFLGVAPEAFMKLFNERGDCAMVVAAHTERIVPLLPLLPTPVYHAEFCKLCFYVFAPSTMKGNP